MRIRPSPLSDRARRFAGNRPGLTEIVPLLIVIKLEEYDAAGAAAIGLAMVAISFGALILINTVQLLLARRGRR